MERVLRALIVLLSALAIAGPAAADGVFPFTSLGLDHVSTVTKNRVIFDSAGINSGESSSDPEVWNFVTKLNVFEGGKFLTWAVPGDFSGACNANNTSSTVAMIYVSSGAKSGSINCDGLEVGLGGTARRTLAATYQTTTNISKNIVEFTGVLTGRYQFFGRPSDSVATFDGNGSVRQHAKFQITQTGCQVLVYEIESNVREEYADLDNDRHTTEDKVWVDQMTSTSECHLTR